MKCLELHVLFTYLKTNRKQMYYGTPIILFCYEFYVIIYNLSNYFALIKRRDTIRSQLARREIRVG